MAPITAPRGTPSNVSARVLSSTSMLITWDEVECLQRNGIITNYNVQYEPNNYSALPMTMITVNNFLMVTNLIPRTNYTFQVAAENTNGTGPNETVRYGTDLVESKQSLTIYVIALLQVDLLIPLTEGVVLFHNGSFLSNNSIINMDKIGVGAMSLLCFTNKLDCCGEASFRIGEWYFPNKSVVPVQNEGIVYRDRDASVVRLNWRSHSDPHFGVFQCQIPDINDTIQNVYVGVYPRNAGM